MSIQVGLHMCGWGDHPLPDVLVAARELGDDGVELAPAWLEAAYGLDRLGHMLADEGVALAPAVFVGGLSLDEQRLPNLLATARRYARWMKAHGAHKAIYSTVPGSNGQRTTDERKALFRVCDAVADAVIAEGCTPLYHNHYVVSHAASRALLDEDLRGLDWSRWKLCADTGHLVLAFTEPVGFFQAWADKVAWVHCKDVRTATFEHPEGPRPMGEIAERHFTALGTGVVDFAGVVAELRRVDYDGWLVVEQDASPDPRATSTISLEHLRRALRGVGRP